MEEEVEEVWEMREGEVGRGGGNEERGRMVNEGNEGRGVTGSE